MDSVFFVFLLPVLLAILMMGLGLELRVKDFIRVLHYPKVIFIALFIQLILLTSLAFLICIILDLPPLLAVGLMLLAASPGGPTANLFSYLYKGDLALNFTLTTINTFISIFTLPFIINLSLHFFLGSDDTITMPAMKMVQVFFIILLPVIFGMALRAKFPRLTITVNRSMRIFAIGFLIALFVFTVVRERHNLMEYFNSIGIATVIFGFSSLFIGYCLPLLLGIPDRQARACTFEVGIHNTAVAMTIAITVLGNNTIAIPAGIYTIVMYTLAIFFGIILSRQRIIYQKSKQRLSDL